jgi:anti-sigma-K factor RskA
MTISPDDDFAAAEYALGTLDASERETLAARRLREPELDEAILAWEARLSPLAEAAPEIAPPRDLLPAIEARIRGASLDAPGSAAVVELERSIRRWRAMAIVASLFAGVLAIGFVARETSRRSASHEYVAILQKDAASPAFAVTVNLDKQELTVRPVAARAPPGKSYELWIIDAKLGAPRSLGVIGDAPRGASLSAYDPAVVAGAIYAVTVEPPGGSPDGKPSGAPVFVGKLIPVAP